MTTYYAPPTSIAITVPQTRFVRFAPAPVGQTLLVGAEDRSLLVGAEDRVLVVPAE